MTKSHQNPNSCEKCQGKHYVLKSFDGRVEARLCGCFQCEICGGRGQVFAEDETGVSFVRACECAGLQKRLDHFNDANIPPKYAEVSFSNFKVKNRSLDGALGTSKDFVDKYKINLEKNSYNSLLIMGRPGVGKTHLAVSILKALLLEQGVRGKFIDFFQLLSDIRHGYSQDLSEQAIINPFVHAPVLVIDELAKGRNTEWELTMLDQIISHRYNNGRVLTIFTTNYIDQKEYGNKERNFSKSTFKDPELDEFKKDIEKEFKLSPQQTKRVFDFKQYKDEEINNEEVSHRESVLVREGISHGKIEKILKRIDKKFGNSQRMVDTAFGISDKQTLMMLETLQEKIGERIYSRLTEMCRFITIKADDYRKNKNY